MALKETHTYIFYQYFINLDWADLLTYNVFSLYGRYTNPKCLKYIIMFYEFILLMPKTFSQYVIVCNIMFPWRWALRPKNVKNDILRKWRTDICLLQWFFIVEKSCEVDTQCKMKAFEMKFWYLHPIVFVNQCLCLFSEWKQHLDNYTFNYHIQYVSTETCSRWELNLQCSEFVFALTINTDVVQG